MAGDAEQFFDEMGADYDGAIERCVPRYREMMAAMLAYSPANTAATHILELGCGTGNLTSLIARQWPAAQLTLVDVSAELLGQCRRRIGEERATYLCEDFRQLDLPSGQYDLAFSSIAIHHLKQAEKRTFFRSLCLALKPSGVFMFADQFAGANEMLYSQHMQQWEQAAIQAGASREEWALWMQHQAEHDFHEPLYDQMSWLRESGFELVDCVWRRLLWAVVHARRGA